MTLHFCHSLESIGQEPGLVELGGLREVLSRKQSQASDPDMVPEKQLKINQVVAEVAQERAEFGLNLQNRFIGRLCLHYSTLSGLKIVVKTCAHCNTAGRRPTGVLLPCPEVIR